MLYVATGVEYERQKNRTVHRPVFFTIRIIQPGLRPGNDGLFEYVYALEVAESDFDTCYERFFSFSQPYARVVVLLVRGFRAFRVSDLGLEVSLFIFHIVAYAFHESELSVRVDVHLHDTVSDCLADLFERRAGTAVEYEVDRIFTRAVFFCMYSWESRSIVGLSTTLPGLYTP